MFANLSFVITAKMMSILEYQAVQRRQ